MGLCRESPKCLRHSAEEEGLRGLLAAVPVRCSNKLFGFRHRECVEQIWKHWLQRAAEPEVEEVRQVRVSYVVVVWRVGGDDRSGVKKLPGRIGLNSRPALAKLRRRQEIEYLRDPFNPTKPIAAGIAERRSFRVVPGHRESLPRERTADETLCRRRYDRPVVRGVVHSKRQIQGYRLGVRCRAGAAVPQSLIIIRQPGSHGVAADTLGRFANQVGEIRQGDELSGREEVAVAC